MGFIRQGISSTGKIESSLVVKRDLAKFAAISSKDNFVVDKVLSKKETVDTRKVKRTLGR